MAQFEPAFEQMIRDEGVVIDGNTSDGCPACDARKLPEQEPVAWAMLHDNGHFIDAIHPDEHARVQGEYTHPLYTTPPQRTWVGLTDEDELDWEDGDNLQDLVKAIETKLKEKNT